MSDCIFKHTRIKSDYLLQAVVLGTFASGSLSYSLYVLEESSTKTYKRNAMCWKGFGLLGLKH